MRAVTEGPVAIIHLGVSCLGCDIFLFMSCSEKINTEDINKKLFEKFSTDIEA